MIGDGPVLPLPLAVSGYKEKGRDPRGCGDMRN